MKLRSKIMLAIVNVILVMGSLATYTVYSYSRDVLIQKEEDSLADLNQSMSRKIYLYLNNQLDITTSICHQDEIMNFIKSEDKSFQNVQILNLLKQYEINDDYSAIYIMDDDGLTWVSTDSSFVGNNYGFRQYFQDAISNQFGFAIVRGVTSGEIGYYFACRIESAGEILGAVVVKLRGDAVSQVFDFHPEPEDQRIFLIEENGIVVYSSDESLYLNSLGVIDDLSQEKIKEYRSFEGLNINPLSYQEIQNDLNVVKDQTLYEVYDEGHESNKKIIINKIQNFNLFLMIESDERSITNPAWEISARLAMYVSAAALLAIIFISILVSRVLLPINNLQDFATKISKGDYSIQIDEKGNDEFANLAKAFNKLNRSLKKEKETTDEKIKERTEDLERLNKYMTGRELKMIELKEKIRKQKNNI